MQVLNGFVKIHRKLIQWGWYQDNVVKGVFLHLLLTASFKDSMWMGRKIKAGQVIVGTEKMAADLGFTRQQIRTAIKKLKSTNEITTEITNRFTIVTIVNWEDYQVYDEQLTSKSTNSVTNSQPADIVTKVLSPSGLTKKSTSKSTSKETLESLANTEVADTENILLTNSVTNKQPTDNQQITNKQPHLKKVKEVKEGKEKRKPLPDPLLGGLSEAEKAKLRAELRE